MQFIEEQATAWLVGLEPLAVDHQLWNGALAHVANDFFRRGRIVVHVDFGVRNPVRLKELLGGAAISAPPGCINLHLHVFILALLRW
jgi:hypothetical protein